MAWKKNIDVGAGVVDRDFRGELKVLLCNQGKEEVEIEKGDRVAQLIVEKIYNPLVVVVGGLEDTSRGTEGFGSTGVNEVTIKSKEDLLIIEQQWPFESPRWEQEEGRITLCAGKTHHLRPGGMKWIYLPFRVAVMGGFL